MKATTSFCLCMLLLVLSGCTAGYGLKQRQEFVDNPLHSYLTEQEKEAILNGQLYKGMPRDLLIASWGPPYDINTSVGQYGKREQFVYRFTKKSRCYVYVDDGLVTGWQY